MGHAEQLSVAIVGGGPAGLMAAEVAAAGGALVSVYEAMPTCGRKFLLAGKGGLNLTHAEDSGRLLARYGEAAPALRAALAAFDGPAVRAWAHGLGIDTRIGSSGRVFPTDLKAAPLLRRWLARLRGAGVRFVNRRRWLGWSEAGELLFDAGDGERHIARPAASVFALGGASWPALGADGGWVDAFRAAGVELAPLAPTNCGFECAWSEHLRERHAGSAVKNVRLSTATAAGGMASADGEFVITGYGIEGGAVYALSAPLRETLARHGRATLAIDLLPARPVDALTAALARPRGKRSVASWLERSTGLRGAKAALLREVERAPGALGAAALATTLKALPLTLTAARPLTEAISSAGGVRFAALNESFMLRARPGTFCAGEMLDWEAPTGGYLLTACFATGRAAAAGALAWLAGERRA